MFSISVRIRKKHIAVAAAALVLALAGGIWLRSARTELKVSSVKSENQAQAMQLGKAQGKTNAQRLAFLNSFGWEVQEQEIEIQEILIPNQFDDVYSLYNELQLEQGADLTKYAGKKCRRYSYVITNYPDMPKNIRANILVYNDKIIAGDICCIELDGFMHGFEFEEQAEATF